MSSFTRSCVVHLLLSFVIVLYQHQGFFNPSDVLYHPSLLTSKYTSYQTFKISSQLCHVKSSMYIQLSSCKLDAHKIVIQTNFTLYLIYQNTLIEHSHLGTIALATRPLFMLQRRWWGNDYLVVALEDENHANQGSRDPQLKDMWKATHVDKQLHRGQYIEKRART